MVGEPSSRWRMPSDDRHQPDGTPQVTGEFDPYREWLGIETPAPTYYELLGLDEDEQNLTRIAAAADRAIARVRAFRPGPRAPQWSQLLDELKFVKQVLTCPDQKKEYDVTLGSQKNKGRGKRSGKSRRPPQTHFTPNPSPIDGPAAQGMNVDAKGFAPSGEVAQSESASTAKSPADSNRFDDGLDLSFLNSPPPKPAKKAPPREGELLVVPVEKFEQVDDIVLPPSIRSAPDHPDDPRETSPPSPRPPAGGKPPVDPASTISRVRAPSTHLAAKRKRHGAWRTRVMSSLMTGLLIALGVYAFIFFEDPNVSDGLADGFPESGRSGALLSEEQRAAILAESERRSQAAELAQDEDLVVGSTDFLPAEELDEGPPENSSRPELPTMEIEHVDIFPEMSDSHLSISTSSEPSPSGMPLSPHVGEIRLALSEQRLEDAENCLAQARSAAKTSDERARLDGYGQLVESLRDFQEAAKRAMASLEPGTSFATSPTSEVVVVERLPDAIRIRLAGQNHLFPLNELPLMLGRALAERGMQAGSRSKVVLGAFQFVHKRARAEHLEEVRRWWTEAQEQGEDVEKLLLLLD